MEQMLKNNPPAKRLRVSMLKYIVSTIIICILKRKEQHWSKHMFVALSSAILKCIAYNYESYFAYLEVLGVVERTESYQVGHYCKKARIKWLYEELRQERITDSWLIRRLELSWKKSGKKEAPDYLRRWFNAQLTIDEGAFSACCDLKVPMRGELAIKKIQSGDFSQHRSTKSLRLHSNLTSMSKLIRPYLKYDGVSLVSCDISTCHPFIIANTLLNPLFYSSNHILVNNCHTKQLNNTYTNTINLSSIIDIYNTSKARRSEHEGYNVAEFNNTVREFLNEKDVAVFKKLVADGSIIDYLMEQIAPLPRCKKKVKKILLMEIDKNPKHNYRWSRRISALFPNVFRVINLYRDKGSDLNSALPWYRAEKPHATLSVMLQFMESFLVVDQVCWRISLEYPEVPLFTVHDCILTTEGNESIVRDYMESILVEIIGTKPRIKTEYLRRQVKKASEPFVISRRENSFKDSNLPRQVPQFSTMSFRLGA